VSILPVDFSSYEEGMLPRNLVSLAYTILLPKNPLPQLRLQSLLCSSLHPYRPLRLCQSALLTRKLNNQRSRASPSAIISTSSRKRHQSRSNVASSLCGKRSGAPCTLSTTTDGITGARAASSRCCNTADSLCVSCRYDEWVSDSKLSYEVRL
jgi:hypothetical protein